MNLCEMSDDIVWKCEMSAADAVVTEKHGAEKRIVKHAPCSDTGRPQMQEPATADQEEK